MTKTNEWFWETQNRKIGHFHPEDFELESEASLDDEDFHSLTGRRIAEFRDE